MNSKYETIDAADDNNIYSWKLILFCCAVVFGTSAALGFWNVPDTDSEIVVRHYDSFRQKRLNAKKISRANSWLTEACDVQSTYLQIGQSKMYVHAIIIDWQKYIFFFFLFQVQYSLETIEFCELLPFFRIWFVAQQQMIYVFNVHTVRIEHVV